MEASSIITIRIASRNQIRKGHVFGFAIFNAILFARGLQTFHFASRIASQISLLRAILTSLEANGRTFKSPFNEKMPNECIKILQLSIITAKFETSKVKI